MSGPAPSAYPEDKPSGPSTARKGTTSEPSTNLNGTTSGGYSANHNDTVSAPSNPDTKPLDDISQPINDIFHRSNWINLSKADYDLLEPTLRMVSRLLEEPGVMAFFAGLLKKKKQPVGNEHTEKKWGKMYKFSCEPTTATMAPNGLYSQAVEQLIAMKKCVSWKFVLIDDNTWAFTKAHPGPKVAGLTPDGFASIVELNAEILDVLRGHVTLADFPKTQGFDAGSALLRTQLFLAITILHELCHAFGHAHIGAGLEPFFENHRLAELGNAFEMVFFDGEIHPSGKNSRLIAPDKSGSSSINPYGTTSVPWPGASCGDPNIPSLATPVFWGVTHWHGYPVLISDVARYFTQTFWDKDVANLGVDALKLKRVIGARWIKKSTREDHEKGQSGITDPQPPVPDDVSLERMGFMIKPVGESDLDSPDSVVSVTMADASEYESSDESSDASSNDESGSESGSEYMDDSEAGSMNESVDESDDEYEDASEDESMDESGSEYVDESDESVQEISPKTWKRMMKNRGKGNGKDGAGKRGGRTGGRGGVKKPGRT